MGEAFNFRRNEVDSTYVDENDRFVVSLIVSYGESDAPTAKAAAAAALELTREKGSGSTQWYVHDRKLNKTLLIEQKEFEDTFTIGEHEYEVYE